MIRYQQTAVHSLTAKVLHWGFIVVFAYGLVRQVDEVEELEDTAFLMEEIVFAIIFLMLLFARFIYMRATRPSVLPDHAPRLVLRLAQGVHLGIYVSLALLALSGLSIGLMYASAVKDGAVFEFVLWLHEAAYWTSVNLIALHVVGAIYHRYLGDGVWSSMVPLLTERTRLPPTTQD